MTPTLTAIAIALILSALLITYLTLNAARAWDTMQAVRGNNRLKRTTYSEKELAQKDYNNYAVMFTISLISLLTTTVTCGILFFIMLNLTGKL